MSDFKDLNIPILSGRQGVYVDLDTLYDTRFAIFEEFDQKAAIEALLKGWNHRLFDWVDILPKELFDQLYSARNRKTLEIAARTPIIGPMKSWIDQASITMAGTPFGGFVEVFLNVWPFKLTKEEADEQAKKLSENYLDGAKVYAINVDPKTITPQVVRSYFSALFMFNWDTWIEAQSIKELFRGCLLPNVNLYAPRIIRGTYNDDTRGLLDDMQFFSKIEYEMCPLIGIQFLDVDLFSTPITREIAYDFFVAKKD